ncbi:MAG: glycine zipper domain-containing protein [Phycisphaerales bacterium]|jgi:outer membrane lipoprotein SlyB|nr:glycine zipper domain-containing protein [Phycisphaerales bacterium]
MRVLMMTAASISIGLLGACDNSAKSGTLIGAGTGALAGQAIGGNTEGTLIGAGVGALGGYLVGNEMDKDRARKQREQEANSPVYQNNTESERLRAENERLRLQAENERLRRQLEDD